MVYSYALFFVSVTMIVCSVLYFLVEAPFCNLRVGRLKGGSQKKERLSGGDYKRVELEALEEKLPTHAN